MKIRTPGCGVAVIVAVAAMAATLFGPKISLMCISLMCSYMYMRTFQLKAHYKPIKILAVSFTETTTSDKSWAGDDNEVSTLNLIVFQILYWTVGKV